ncbi:50S ribosomal protein L18Ae [Methanocella arvoryzae]|uniref:Large ribosomal subunit protein eL20 n=1 Tax=Methanocella arvoryzae (strain DSM 22066 / NBRC 105507 / MRE50) TaxID=351160 RepID=Q0W5H3_METAR|nr:50S ribosomal protein L18Ae [Methanocella arvoryzae]CAJ36370.2 50S ribosomal protein LX [Methanocella arvoryzae MRE50]
MAKFVVQGSFQAGVQREKFSVEVEAVNARNAEEKVYTTFGSKHKVERRLIKIESVKEA